MVIAVLLLSVVVMIFAILPLKGSGNKYCCLLSHIYAHRGYHNNFLRIPENSMISFQRAVEKGYGIELDVQITKDNRLVVLHDNNTVRLTGFSFEIQNSTYNEINNLRLIGTDQKIPLLTEVLELVHGRVPLIIELKDCVRYKDMIDNLLSILNQYKGWFCIQSFNPLILGYLRRKDKNILRGQLSGMATKYNTDIKSPVLRIALSNLLLNFISRPNFIAYEFEHCNKNIVRLFKIAKIVVIPYTVKGKQQSLKASKDFLTYIFEEELFFEGDGH